MKLYRPIEHDERFEETDTREYLRSLFENRRTNEIQQIRRVLRNTKIVATIDDFLENDEEVDYSQISVAIAKVLRDEEEEYDDQTDFSRCIFLAKRDSILDRNIFGRYLCKESGIEGTYVTGILLYDYEKKLCCCFGPKKFLPEMTVNRLLMTRKQLEQVLAEEEKRDELISVTPFKKDISHALKLISLGMYGGKISRNDPKLGLEERLMSLLTEG